MTSGEGDGTSMAEAVAPLWSADRVASALEVLPNDLAAMRHCGSLLGLQTSDGDFFYPLSQFQMDSDGTVRVRPGLQQFLTILAPRHDPWAIALVLQAPADELGGVSPLEWVRNGEPAEPLTEYAHVLDSEWSR